MSAFPFFMVNAFGNGPQSGNPAGVCFLDEWKSTHELQSFATQVCLPETAFVIPSKKDNWAIRWFSTSHEVDLCGHATLAAAYCLSKTNDIQEINFSSKSGVLKTIVHSDETVSITLPASHARTSKLSAQLVEGLGAYPEGVWKGANYLCLFESEEIIQSLQPDFTVLRSIKETVGVIVTAPSTCKDYDFASRYFAPRIGIREDHATGSAHCMLIPFWSKRFSKQGLHAIQLSERGGAFYGEDMGEEIVLRGNAEKFMTGEIRF